MAITLNQDFLIQALIDENSNDMPDPFIGMLFACKVGLFVNSPIISNTNVFGDFTIPTYTTYAAKTVVWSAPFIDAGGQVMIASGIESFQCTTAPDSGIALNGYYLYNSTIPHTDGMIGAEYFANPVNMTTTLNGPVFLIELVMPQLQVYGGAILL